MDEEPTYWRTLVSGFDAVLDGPAGDTAPSLMPNCPPVLATRAPAPRRLWRDTHTVSRLSTHRVIPIGVCLYPYREKGLMGMHRRGVRGLAVPPESGVG